MSYVVAVRAVVLGHLDPVAGQVRRVVDEVLVVIAYRVAEKLGFEHVDLCRPEPVLEGDGPTRRGAVGLVTAEVVEVHLGRYICQL